MERRFAEKLQHKVREMPTVAVTEAEHQPFTNAWRQAIKYGEGTANATKEQVRKEARRIYSGYSEILRALGL